MATVKHQLHRARGATMLEMLGVILVIGILVAGGLALLDKYLDFQKAQTTASWLKTWQKGATSYMKDNSASLVASGGGTYTQAQILAASSTYFPVGFAAAGPYGQTASLRVTIAGGQAQGIVCAAGGQDLTDADRRRVANLAGPGGGYVLHAQPDQLRGTIWGPVASSTYGLNAGACQLVGAIFVADAATQDDYIHRSVVAGHPEFQRMNAGANLDMNGNAIANVSDVKTKAAGQGITFYGGGESIVGLNDFSISFRTNNNQERMRLYNDGHLGMNSYLTLPAGNAIAMGSSWLYGDTANMALRPAANGGTVYIQGTASGGGQANLYAAGNIQAAGETYTGGWFRSAGCTGWYNETYGTGTYACGDNTVRVYGDHNFTTGGAIVGGQVISNGRMTANEFFQINGRAAAGTGCGPNGVEGRASDGSPLWCVNGVWRGAGGGARSWSVVANYINSNYNGHNWTDHDMEVSAYSNGTSCGNLNNDFNAYGYVNGLQVAATATNNTAGFQQFSMDFTVPSGSDYSIQWHGSFRCNTQTVVLELK